jgi:thiol-disulfide isomerase/thioredoxin
MAPLTQENDLHWLPVTSHRFRTIVLFALLSFIVSAGSATPKSTLVNKPAPPFARTDLQNKPVDLAALRGRVVLLNFWATWCAPCLIEMPRFSQWQEKYSGQGLAVLGVSMDDDSATVQALLRKRKVNYPIVMGDEKLGLAYGGVLGLPITYLIDRRGVIRARFQGETNLDAIEKRLRQMLATH